MLKPCTFPIIPMSVSDTMALANPTTVPELQMQRETTGMPHDERTPLMETDSLSDASSTSADADTDAESEAFVHHEQNEEDESSVDDRDLPDDVIHSVTLRNNNNELMTFTLRTAEKGLQVVDISGATPLTLSAEAFQGIVDDLFYDVKQEEKRKEWAEASLDHFEAQRQYEWELLVSFLKIFGTFFLFLLMVVAIARVL